ncbi:MAG: hypothetical protein J6040_06560, partial [Clostridiales bacterium]|nr:hypothetical protein [Clostridiales bacterium]
MNTPILDFVRNYAASNAVRMHMPGHKGKGAPEAAFDITEIAGADDLFHANGIIGKSEQNASRIFGCDTYYSTEGSSLCIRAMLYLCRAASKTEKPWILAARNVHQTGEGVGARGEGAHLRTEIDRDEQSGKRYQQKH